MNTLYGFIMKEINISTEKIVKLITNYLPKIKEVSITCEAEKEILMIYCEAKYGGINIQTSISYTKYDLRFSSFDINSLIYGALVSGILLKLKNYEMKGVYYER